MCKVVHFKKDDFDIYIGRMPFGKHNKWEYPRELRNQFAEDADREDIINGYEKYLL